MSAAPATHAGQAAPAAPVYRPVGDTALMVEFGDVIDAGLHARVLALDAALAAAPFPGFREAVPAYASLMVRFDPIETDHAAAITALDALLAHAPAAKGEPARREVAVCYDGDLGPDLAVVAEATGLSVEAVIAAHLAGDYSVFLYGFAPGYAYMAGVPEALRLPRKPAAVRDVPAGSVIIAGPQCLVTTLTMPTGWWRLGRSPTAILTGDAGHPFLFDVGDHVRFRRISLDDYHGGRG